MRPSTTLALYIRAICGFAGGSVGIGRVERAPGLRRWLFVWPAALAEPARGQFFFPPLAAARRRCWRKAYAIMAISAWRLRPRHERPSKWSRPSSSCGEPARRPQRALIVAASVLRSVSAGRLAQTSLPGMCCMPLSPIRCGGGPSATCPRTAAKRAFRGAFVPCAGRACAISLGRACLRRRRRGHWAHGVCAGGRVRRRGRRVRLRAGRPLLTGMPTAQASPRALKA